MSQDFVDYVQIYVRAGKGGDGCMSFRREKFAPNGGPDGGDGGDGGSIWLEADPKMTTLGDFKSRPSLKAGPGQAGLGSQCTGKKGEDLVVRVPLGTVVSLQDGTELGDLLEPGQRFCAAAGGRGGLGNQNFATPVIQAPRKTTPGTPGEERRLVLELKLIAQAGFVGLPNAGKSTLLAHLTRATPKIASYPFTTLHPNLGVMEVDAMRRVTLADIPGLIEGAHSGQGLGDKFLRHIERTGLLVHLVAPPETIPDAHAVPEIAEEEFLYAYDLIRKELESYSTTLAGKPELVVLTKIDKLTETDKEVYMNALRKLGKKPIAISSEVEVGLDELKSEIVRLLDQHELIPLDGGVFKGRHEDGGQ